MADRTVEQNKVLEEFEQVVKALDEVLKDLEWRKPDVEKEEAELIELKRMAREGSSVDVESQEVIVRVFRSVLADKIAEAHALEKRMLELKEKIEALERVGSEPTGGAEGGETVHKET